MEKLTYAPQKVALEAKTKLALLILLNALDGILTYVGIAYGYAIELNPITKSFMHDFGLVLLIKILLPTVLIASAMYYLQKSIIHHVYFIRALINTAVIIYTFLLCNHFFVLYQLVIYAFGL